MSILIRRATPADHAGVAALLNRYYTDWNVVQRDTPAKLAADLAHPTLGFLVAEDASQLAGCVLLRDLPGVAHAVECKRLFVLESFRGRGLARQLMDAAEAQAALAAMQWIYLDTTEDFAAALALYRQRGYQDCERYNSNPQATIFLRKRLPHPAA